MLGFLANHEPVTTDRKDAQLDEGKGQQEVVAADPSLTHLHQPIERLSHVAFVLAQQEGKKEREKVGKNGEKFGHSRSKRSGARRNASARPPEQPDREERVGHEQIFIAKKEVCRSRDTALEDMGKQLQQEMQMLKADKRAMDESLAFMHQFQSYIDAILASGDLYAVRDLRQLLINRYRDRPDFVAKIESIFASTNGSWGRGYAALAKKLKEKDEGTVMGGWFNPYDHHIGWIENDLSSCVGRLKGVIRSGGLWDALCLTHREKQWFEMIKQAILEEINELQQVASILENEDSSQGYLFAVEALLLSLQQVMVRNNSTKTTHEEEIGKAVALGYKTKSEELTKKLADICEQGTIQKILNAIMMVITSIVVLVLFVTGNVALALIMLVLMAVSATGVIDKGLSKIHITWVKILVEVLVVVAITLLSLGVAAAVGAVEVGVVAGEAAAEATAGVAAESAAAFGAEAVAESAAESAATSGVEGAVEEVAMDGAEEATEELIAEEGDSLSQQTEGASKQVAKKASRARRLLPSVGVGLGSSLGMVPLGSDIAKAIDKDNKALLIALSIIQIAIALIATLMGAIGTIPVGEIGGSIAEIGASAMGHAHTLMIAANVMSGMLDIVQASVTVETTIKQTEVKRVEGVLALLGVTNDIVTEMVRRFQSELRSEMKGFSQLISNFFNVPYMIGAGEARALIGS